MPVTTEDVRAAVRALGLSHRPLCVHSSLHSFGWVEGGAATVVDGLLAEGCTVLVPAFSPAFAVPPPPDRRLVRNGWDYDRFPGPTGGLGRVYTPDSQEIDKAMGAIPAAVVGMPGRSRGNHPGNSFAAVGPLAHDLIAEQAPMNVYAPLRRLAAHGGWVVLMGVGLNRLTLIHLAEQMAGRRLFRRWANGPDGQPIAVEAGGCSAGFGRLEPVLAPLMERLTVGRSPWLVLPAQATLAAAARAIQADPMATHCGDPQCERCNDAVLGGPVDP